MSIKKGEVRYPGEIMLLQDKNSNILVYGAYFWFDTKMIIKIEIFLKRIFVIGWKPNNNNVSLRCILIRQ